jgi:hypothetical protein
MKKGIVFIIMVLLSLSLVFANGEGSHGEDDGHDELVKQMESDMEQNSNSGHSMEGEMGFSHQMQMILPFSHLQEGHWFAGIMLILMWLSLVYVGYQLTQKFKK